MLAQQAAAQDLGIVLQAGHVFHMELDYAGLTQDLRFATCHSQVANGPIPDAG